MTAFGIPHQGQGYLRGPHHVVDTLDDWSIWTGTASGTWHYYPLRAVVLAGLPGHDPWRLEVCDDGLDDQLRAVAHAIIDSVRQTFRGPGPPAGSLAVKFAGGQNFLMGWSLDPVVRSATRGILRQVQEHEATVAPPDPSLWARLDKMFGRQVCI